MLLRYLNDNIVAAHYFVENNCFIKRTTPTTHESGTGDAQGNHTPRRAHPLRQHGRSRRNGLDKIFNKLLL